MGGLGTGCTDGIGFFTTTCLRFTAGYKLVSAYRSRNSMVLSFHRPRSLSPKKHINIRIAFLESIVERKHSRIGNKISNSKTRAEERSGTQMGRWNRAKREASVDVNDFEVDVMMWNKKEK